MTLQNFLKTLKTAKRTYPSSVYNLLIYSSSINQTPNPTKHPLPLADLNLSTLRRILSDPNIKPWKCISLFNFINENPNLFSFQPDLNTRLSLTLRVLSERKFTHAHQLLKHDILKYPFRDIASIITGEKKLVAKFFNSVLIVYSENDKFDDVIEVFEYMKEKEIKIDEKSCTLHLLNLKKVNRVELVTVFFTLMVNASVVDVSVYALTVIVSVLCWNGEISRARELVEKEKRIIKANIVTFKCMINCCVKRWDFNELDLVLELMEKESVLLDCDCYKILVEGYASFGKIGEAEKLVSMMHDNDLVVESYLYNLIINGCFRLGLAEKAFKLRGEMSSRGVMLNKDTYVILIEGCYRGGMVDKYLEVVAEMIREGFVPDVPVFERLVDALLEVNREEARMMVTFLVKSGIKPKSCWNIESKNCFE